VKGHRFMGKTLPPYERFPYDCEWGYSAWSFTKKKTALLKFKSFLINKNLLVTINDYLSRCKRHVI
jgi:hypothetical protein